MQSRFLAYRRAIPSAPGLVHVVAMDHGMASGEAKNLDQAITDLLKTFRYFVGNRDCELVDSLHKDRPKSGRFIEIHPRDLLPLLILAARKKSGMTQIEVAVRMGIKAQVYARLECFGANPRMETLIQLEKSLGKELVNWNTIQPIS